MGVENQLLNFVALARLLKLPARWLKAEALAGRIANLRVGRRLMFNPKAVERALAERASKGDGQ